VRALSLLSFCLSGRHCLQRSGMAKLPNKVVPECREHTNCARLSAAKEWTQDECERTRRLYRQNPWQFGRGAVFPPRTAIPLLCVVLGAAFFYTRAAFVVLKKIIFALFVVNLIEVSLRKCHRKLELIFTF